MSAVPNYVMPGVIATPRRSKLVGALAVTVGLLTGLGWSGYLDRSTTAPLRIQLRTTEIGDGIIPGTDVRLDGVPVGEIAAITSSENGHQLITLELDRSQLTGLTDSFTVQYAPANLFGISTLALRRGTGGAALADGAFLDRSTAGQVVDTTMGSLLRSVSAASTDVLTPEFTEVLRQVNTGLEAFAPLLEAIVTLSRAVADTQRYPSSFLIEQYGSVLAGSGALTSSTFELLDGVLAIEVLKNDRALYDTAISMIAHEVFPAVAQIGDAGRTYLTGYIDMLGPLLDAIAGTVPTPGRSGAEVTELLDRLSRAFADTPDGPVVSLDVTLRGMPGLAVPLLGQSLNPIAGGR